MHLVVHEDSLGAAGAESLEEACLDDLDIQGEASQDALDGDLGACQVLADRHLDSQAGEQPPVQGHRADGVALLAHAGPLLAAYHLDQQEVCEERHQVQAVRGRKELDNEDVQAAGQQPNTAHCVEPQLGRQAAGLLGCSAKAILHGCQSAAVFYVYVVCVDFYPEWPAFHLHAVCHGAYVICLSSL